MTIETKTFLFHTPISTIGGIAIDIIDACNLACRTCLRGCRQIPNTRQQMDYSLYTRIIDKAARLGFQHLSLFNWTEPFLCKDLPKYLEYAQKQGLITKISSNLSFPHWPHIIPSLKFCDIFITSVSGFTQKTYSINHHGGNIELVKKNLATIAAAKKRGEIQSSIEVRYFIFDYSEKEFLQFKEFTDHLENITLIPWRGSGNPFSKIAAEHSEKPQQGNALRAQKTFSPSSICGKIPPTFPIGHDGKVYLCCAKANSEATCIGDFLNDDFATLQFRRFTHPLCRHCSSYTEMPLLPHQKDLLLHGMAKSLETESHLAADFSQEAAAREACKGRDVYFWGCGGMYRRKGYLFADASPLCFLVDGDSAHPDAVNGLKVKHPDEVLSNGEAHPVIIFAGAQAQEIIRRTIQEKYPHITEIYGVSSL